MNLFAASLLTVLAASNGVLAQPQILAATLQDRTTRYDHAALGDAIEYGAMVILSRDCPTCAVDQTKIVLPPDQVFEDVEARVVDLDGDGRREVLVVQTDLAKGAALAVYDTNGKVTATANIGAPYRWLAPVGVGDFDDDGRPEIAYIDRPHLDKELVFLRYTQRQLTEISRVKGLTNHHLGQNVIEGGVRRCGGAGDQVVVANADWTQVMTLRLDGKPPQVLRPYRSERDMRRAVQCR